LSRACRSWPAPPYRAARSSPILARLEGVGWLESGWEDVDPTVVGRPALRYYRLALAILPRSARSRYAAEWRADLAQLPEDPTATHAYARSLLRGAPELRRALGRAEGGIPLRCRLGWHRYVDVHDNPESWRYVSRHCTRCPRIVDQGAGAPAGGSLTGVQTHSLGR